MKSKNKEKEKKKKRWSENTDPETLIGSENDAKQRKRRRRCHLYLNIFSFITVQCEKSPTAYSLTFSHTFHSFPWRSFIISTTIIPHTHHTSHHRASAPIWCSIVPHIAQIPFPASLHRHVNGRRSSAATATTTTTAAMDREKGKADDICVPAAAAVYTGKPIVDESGGGGNLTCMSVSFKGRQHSHREISSKWIWKSFDFPSLYGNISILVWKTANALNAQGFLFWYGKYFQLHMEVFCYSVFLIDAQK